MPFHGRSERGEPFLHPEQIGAGLQTLEFKPDPDARHAPQLSNLILRKISDSIIFENLSL
jgi:hypothetical protein